MPQLSRRLLAGTAILAAMCAPQAHAATTVIDFEPAALTGLYLPGDTFTQNGFRLTTRLDFGVIDTAASLGTLAPSGNATQFYFNGNDAALRLQHSDGGSFSLDGFAAAFVPQDPASAQTTVIVARGLTTGNATVTVSFAFASATNGVFPFRTYSGAAFAPLANLTQLDFFACSLVGTAICTQPTLNNGQFAIDNILITVVPEPGAALLLALGLATLGLRASHSRRIPAC